MLKKNYLSFIVCLFLISGCTMDEKRSDVCFSPAENCSVKVVNKIRQAKKEILMQAYVFTDKDILNALMDAKERGVHIGVLLDHSQANDYVFSILEENKVPVRLLKCNGIAHNKTIVIDSKTVIGGSYNYTNAASVKNLENLSIIRNSAMAKKYKSNWYDNLGKYEYKASPVMEATEENIIEINSL